MKRLLGLFLIIICFTSCSSGGEINEQETNVPSSSENVEKEAQETEAAYIKEAEKIDTYMYQKNSQLDGNAIIRTNCELLLKTDGTVVGRGESSFGELGNGQRTKAENWTPVSGLTDVKKIYATSGIGNDSIEGGNLKWEFCYALTENGDLYRWGGNILKPEIFLQGVDDFYSFSNDTNFLINYKDGHKEAIIQCTNLTKAIVDITDLVSDDEVLSIGQNSIIIKDVDTGISSCVEFNIEYGEIIDERHRIHGSCLCTETNRFEIGDNISSIVGGDVLSETGEHARLHIENGIVTFEQEWGGSGYKYYKKIYESSHVVSTFSLLGDKVYTRGDNQYGQLGDGTRQDYYDGWLEVDEFNCVELIAQKGYVWGQYCTALDDENNIWCWGGNFGSSPTIEIPCE